MKSELLALIWKREKLALVSIGLLFCLFGLSLGIRQTSIWQSNHIYNNSTEAIEDQQAAKRAQAQLEDELNQKYEEYGDSQKFWQYVNSVTSIDQVTFDQSTHRYKIDDSYYSSSQTEQLFQKTTIVKNKENKTIQIVGAQDILNSGYFLIGNGDLSQYIFRGFFLFFIIAGFINCFVDYKTNFVLLLRSSRFSNKKIIQTKIALGTMAILLSAIVATVINLSIIYLRIPHEYINISFFYLIAFHGVMIVIGLLLYYISLLAGVICGQLVTGVISLIGFLLGLSFISENLQTYLYYLSFKDISGSDYYYSVNLFSLYPSYQAWAIICLGIILLIAFLYQVTVVLYQKISFENRNQFILLPKLRWPLTIFASLFTAFATTWDMSTVINPLEDETRQMIIDGKIMQAVLVFLVMFMVFVVVNYANRILDFLMRHHRKAHVNK